MRFVLTPRPAKMTYRAGFWGGQVSAFRTMLLLGIALALAHAAKAQTPPVITVPPHPTSVAAGAAATLSVVASGTPPLSYQWQHNGTNLPDIFISTVAGNGSPAFSGDEGPAVKAGLGPVGIAVDALGNQFISDTGNQRIRKVDTNGIITTIAGNGVAGFSGDNGAATNASLNEPFGLRIDPAGNLYFADSANNRVRKVDTNGVITTVAGTGMAAAGGDGGAATEAGLNYPLDVAIAPSGDILIADTGNGRVRRVDSHGIITSLTDADGTGGPLGFDYISSIAVDALGDVFIADEVVGLITEGPTAQVYKVDANGSLSTILFPSFLAIGEDGVTGRDFQISPSGLALDSQGNVYVVDRAYGLVRKVAPDGTITTVAGDPAHCCAGFAGDGGLATRAKFNRPFMAAVDASDQLYITDYDNSRVRKVSLRGTPTFPIVGVPSAVGAYQVVVSNRYGSVTSSPPAMVTVVPAPPGTVFAFGAGLVDLDSDFDEGQSIVPPEADGGVIAVAGGGWHSLALKADGSVIAWGGYTLGPSPNPTPPRKDFVAIAAGWLHSLGLTRDGNVIAWGGNDRGQSTVPAAIQGQVVAIAADGYHSLALTRDGSVVAWGANNQGQTNVPAAARSNVVAIAAGGSHSLALTADGSVIGWGGNFAGQLDVPDSARHGVIAIAAGDAHSLALKNDGSVVAWGLNTTEGIVTGQTNVPPSAESGVVAIAAGGNHCLALKADGTVVAWGHNAHGQNDIPDFIQGSVTGISAGSNHSLMILGTATLQSRLTPDGLLLSWPTNLAGFHLQSAGNLEAAAAWTQVPETPVVVADRQTVTRPLGGAPQWYRLSR